MHKPEKYHAKLFGPNNPRWEDMLLTYMHPLLLCKMNLKHHPIPYN